MSNFNGYQADINGVKLPYIDSAGLYPTYKQNIVVPGSFTVSDEYKILNEWTDINGNTHIEKSPTPKKVIQFTLKERTFQQQARLYYMFKESGYYGAIYIEYWDDVIGGYKRGFFYLEDYSLSSHATKEQVYYAETALTYREL